MPREAGLGARLPVAVAFQTEYVLVELPRRAQVLHGNRGDRILFVAHACLLDVYAGGHEPSKRRTAMI